MTTFEKQCPYPSCGKTFRTVNRPQKYCSRTCARGDKTLRTQETIRAYLLAHIDKPEHPDACWPWQGYISKKTRYGRAFVRGGAISAHRLSYEIFVSPIPEGMYVLHVRHCLLRHCINPRHLYCGTAQENAEDSMAVGHMPHGSQHYKARLNEQKVLEILQKFHDHHTTIQQLVDEYHAGYATISAIIARRQWKHVAPDLYPYTPEKPYRVLNAEDIRAIRQLAADGLTSGAIAKALSLSISPRHIRSIVQRKIWKHLA